MEELFGWLFDLIGEIFSGIGEFFGEIFGSGAGEAIAEGATAIASVAAASMLIGGVIAVTSITVDSIREKLKNRNELISKGVLSVVVSEFIKQADCTIITLDALDASNKSVGQIKMKGQNCNVRKGQRIALS